MNFKENVMLDSIKMRNLCSPKYIVKSTVSPLHINEFHFKSPFVSPVDS